MTESKPKQDSKVVTISAPGKALIAGGYLVLERPNPGLVLATDSSFHVTVTTQPPHCVDSLDRVDDDDHDNENESFPLDVYSPQFHDIYTYNVHLNTNRSLPKTSSSSSASSSSSGKAMEPLLSLRPRYIKQPSNSYIEKTVIVTLSTILAATTNTNDFSPSSMHEFLSSLQIGGDKRALAIKLRADNDFYSIVPHLKEYKLSPIPSEIHKLPSFLPCPIVEREVQRVGNGDGEDHSGGVNVKTVENIVEVNKTGLGSSAALVTSLVGALLAYFDVVSIPSSLSETAITDNKKETDKCLKLVHNLAQICHSFAQGKIGSGFDVSAAVYGSHVYTRFDKSTITFVMDQLSNDLAYCNNKDSGTNNKQYEEKVIMTNTGLELWNCICDFDKWNAQVDPLSLPPGIQVLMADICGGSESPSMAKKVLAWKKNQEEESQKVVDVGEVDGGNSSNRGATEWLELQKVNVKLKNLFQKGSVDGLSTIGGENLLDEIRRSILDSRKYLKAMGESAGVPVEPDEQTKLADDTMNIPGVIAAGIPGAGGYDALFVLYKEISGDDLDADTATVRDTIGRFWMDWCDQRKKDGKRGVVCPLSCKCVGFGEGLRHSPLGW